MSKEKTCVMMRIRNEERWIRRSLERSWQIANTIVILDDGSTDQTGYEAFKTIDSYCEPQGWDSGKIIDVDGPGKDGNQRLIYVKSPFRGGFQERDGQVPHEIVDRQFLWDIVRTRTECPYVLSLDGDEMLSKQAIRTFPKIWEALQDSKVDMLTFPFLYLWDSEDLVRVDDWYSKYATFTRMFNLENLTSREIRALRFRMTENTLHGGSLPLEGFKTPDTVLVGKANAPIIHFGYVDDDLRRRKFEWYRTIDPGNTLEGEYLHIIGMPDQWCPNPPTLVPFEDE